MTLRLGGIEMGSKLFKQFIRKAGLTKQAPPGPPPRPGLKWKPSTHRWIIDQSDPRHADIYPKNHPVHSQSDPQYLTADITGVGFDLHEGQEVLYESFPDGMNVPGVVRWDEYEGEHVVEATGWWKSYFESTGTSPYIKLGGDEGSAVHSDLSEFKQVEDDMHELSTLISAGEQHGWVGDIVEYYQQTLDSVGEAIGYQSAEFRPEGRADSDLVTLMDALTGAFHGQQHIGSPYEGNWKDIQDEVSGYIKGNTPTPAPSPPKVDRSLEWKSPSYQTIEENRPKDAHPYWPFHKR